MKAKDYTGRQLPTASGRIVPLFKLKENKD